MYIHTYTHTRTNKHKYICIYIYNLNIISHVTNSLYINYLNIPVIGQFVEWFRKSAQVL